MDEIDKDEIARIVGHHDERESLRKETAIIGEKRQLSVRIPKKFAELVDIDAKLDKFVFILESRELDPGKITYDLKAELLRGSHGKEEIQSH